MKFIKKNLKIIVIIFTIILKILLILLKIYLNNKANLKEEVVEEIEVIEEVNEEIVAEIETFFVDIKGAVLNPGVYEIEANKKVIDVVNLAGGLTDNADTTLINLAKNITDEMVIIIYTKEEVEKANTNDTVVKVIDKECVCPEIKNDACISSSISNKNTTSNDTTDTVELGKINLNEATLEELQTLTGIGESKAKAIIEYRESIGLFSTIEEVKEVTGIGESLYEKIKDNITV